MTFQRSRPAPDSTQLVNPFAMHQAILIGLSPELPDVTPSLRRLEKSMMEPYGIFSEFGFLVLDDLKRNGNRTMLVHRLNSLAEASQVQEFQSLVVLFVGHSLLAPHYRLLLPERSLPTPQQAEERDWLDWNTFLEWFAPVRTHNLLMMMDTQHAKTLQRRETLQWLFQQHDAQAGQKLFWGAGCEMPSAWSNAQNTFWVEALVEALEGWDARSDRGVVHTDALFAFLQRRVGDLTHRKTGRTSVPFRLQWPERPTKPWDLTVARPRHELDDALKDAVLAGRCLLWVGEDLAERTLPTPFPHRSQWEGSQRRVWLEYADFQREPGPSCFRVASLRMNLLDSGVDSSLEQACRQADYVRWIPQAQEVPPTANSPTLFRLSGGVGTADYCYDWEDLEHRFHLLFHHLQQHSVWDTLLLVGFPVDEVVPRRWLERLLQIFPQCWMVFPHGEDHDKAATFRHLGIKLIMAKDTEVLPWLEAISHLQATSEKTKPVRLRLPPRPSSSAKAPEFGTATYLGLRPYESTDTSLFWGRGVHKNIEEFDDLDALRSDIHLYRKVVLYGDSGVGKTSLLRAGLFPTLERVDRFRILYADSEDPWTTWVEQIKDAPCFLEPPTPDNVLERMGYFSMINQCSVLVCVDHLDRINTNTAATDSFFARWQRAVMALEQAWPSAPWRLLVCANTTQYATLESWIRYGESPGSSTVHSRELRPFHQKQAEHAILGIAATSGSSETSRTTTGSVSSETTKPSDNLHHFTQHTIQQLMWFATDTERAFSPAQIQTICFFGMKRSLHQGNKQIDVSCFPKELLDWPEGLVDCLQQDVLSVLSKTAQNLARDFLILLAGTNVSRRCWQEEDLHRLLANSYTEEEIQRVQAHLVSFGVVVTKHTSAGRNVELAHEMWLPAVKKLGWDVSQLAQQVYQCWQMHRRKEQDIVPHNLVKSLQHAVAAWEKIPSNERSQVQEWHRTSTQYYRKKRTIQATVAVFVCLCIGLLVWFLRPPSVASVIQQHISAFLQEGTGEQAKFWLAMNVFEKKENREQAQHIMTQRLLASQGESACKLLRALHHITGGDLVSVVHKVTGKKGPFVIHSLHCPAHTMFKGIRLQGAMMVGSQAALVDWQQARLTGADLRLAQWPQGKLQGAQLMRVRLEKSSLFGANLQGADLSQAQASWVDFRQAKLQGIRLYQATLTGALFTSQQISDLNQSAFSLKDAVCLTGHLESSTASGLAGSCYRWHQQEKRSGEPPQGCPAVLRGPIVVFTVLATEGKCPERMLQQVSLEAAFCPSAGHPICADGALCRKKQADACYRLGRRYETGQQVELDLTTAAALYQKACEYRDVSSCYALGTFFLRGRGVVQDEKQAASYFSTVCEKNHGPGCAALAVLLEKGWGPAQDLARAFALYRKACDQKIARGCIGLGYGYQSGLLGEVDRKKATALFQQTCEWKDGMGCYLYARLLASQRKQRQQAESWYVKARSLLERACDQDDAESCGVLGILWQKGLGGKTDMAMAVQLLNKSCQQNHGLGCNALGLLYFAGKGVKQSYATALALYQKACQRNDGESCDNAGSMYERGHGVARDYKRAHQFYLQSCLLGHGWGCNALADLYQLGRGIRRNRRQAKLWYRKACQLGVSSACP